MRVKITQDVCSGCGQIVRFHKPYYTKAAARIFMCSDEYCMALTYIGLGTRAGSYPDLTAQRVALLVNTHVDGLPRIYNPGWRGRRASLDGPVVTRPNDLGRFICL